MQRIFTGHQNGKALLVLLVPYRRDTSSDPVVALSSIIRNCCRGSADSIFMPKRPDHFSEIQPTGRRLWRHVVLFAHPSPSADGFAVNPQEGEQQSSLTTEWWYTQNHKFDLIVAHVCNGQRILGRTEWQQLFPNWISYDVDIHTLLMTSRDRKLWGEVAESIVNAAAISNTLKSAKDRIRSSYLLKMAYLRDSGTKRDLIHLLHFQKALEGITSNEEN
jgi:hypothetical protein